MIAINTDKYADLRAEVKNIFKESSSKYGYRRIHSVIKSTGTTVSEKVIRRITKEEDLVVRISNARDSALIRVNSPLRLKISLTAISQLREGEKTIVHSDWDCHYRWPGWLESMAKSKLTRSMSKKGCSPDNSACEGFFGRLKNEMFYGYS